MSDVGADDDVEPYKSLVEERDRIAANKKRIAQALLTGGRRKRIFIDQPAGAAMTIRCNMRAGLRATELQ